MAPRCRVIGGELEIRPCDGPLRPLVEQSGLGVPASLIMAIERRTSPSRQAAEAAAPLPRRAISRGPAELS